MSPAEALDRIAQFAHLAAGWDSYGAQPITPEAIAAAGRVVAFVAECGGLPPQPVPTVHGGVHFEGEDTEIVVHSDGTIEVLP